MKNKSPSPTYAPDRPFNLATPLKNKSEQATDMTSILGVSASDPDSCRPASQASKQLSLLLEGIAASDGITLGRAEVLLPGSLPGGSSAIFANQIPAEIQRFDEAIDVTRQELSHYQRKLDRLDPEQAEEIGLLFEAYLRMLDDSRLIRDTKRRISEHYLNVEGSLQEASRSLQLQFSQMGNAYLAARADDIAEITKRLLAALQNDNRDGFDQILPGSIIIADEISPAEAALIDPRKIRGFATVQGGREGHSAIVARALDLPAVLGIDGLLDHVNTGDILILDGTSGHLIINPTPDTLLTYQHRQAALWQQRQKMKVLRDKAAETEDHTRIRLFANVELPVELERVKEENAEGIGLLRTEFMFMNRAHFPDENTQYERLKPMISAMNGKQVTIRTLDIGGEKMSSAFNEYISESANPALGLRAVRLGLRHPELLRTQLAAILRVGAIGPIRILLPMISRLDELRDIRAMIEEVATSLKERGIACADPLPPIGIMIEVPAAAISAAHFAKEADFFAIGSNDLTMYTLALDRADEHVAKDFTPLHPAVLSLIQMSVQAAQQADIPISICGEMAGDPKYAPLLIGFGLRDLSMSAPQLSRLKHRLSSLSLPNTEQIAKHCLSLGRAEDIEQFLKEVSP